MPLKEKDYEAYTETQRLPENVPDDKRITYAQALKMLQQICKEGPKDNEVEAEFLEKYKGLEPGDFIPLHDAASFQWVTTLSYLNKYDPAFKNYCMHTKFVQECDSKGVYRDRILYGQYPLMCNGRYPRHLKGLWDYCQDTYGRNSPRLYEYLEGRIKGMGWNYVSSRDEEGFIRSVRSYRFKDTTEQWRMHKPLDSLKIGDECTLVVLDYSTVTYHYYATTRRVLPPENCPDVEAIYIAHDHGYIPWMVVSGYPYGINVKNLIEETYPKGVRLSPLTFNEAQSLNK